MLITLPTWTGQTITVNAPTYGGITMTALGSVTVPGSPTAILVLYGLIGPPAGTQTVVCSLSYSGSLTTYLTANSMSYVGVVGFGTFASNTGTSTSLALSSVPSATGKMVVMGFSAQVAATITSYNQTSRYSNVHTAAASSALLGDAPGAATVSFTGTISSSHGWAAVGAPLL
jgi:hypothetical protein